MTVLNAERIAVVGAICVFVASIGVVAVAAEEAPAEQTIQLGASYSDLGDFGADWGLRVRWNFGNWLLAGGWNNVDDTVASAAGPMKVEGDLWQLDLSYVWWSLNPQRDTNRGRPDWYYGLGIGLANIDADWSLAGVTADAKKVSFAGHVVVGAQWRRVFTDVRYNFATDYWDFDSDGVQVSVGAAWPLK
jgi:hypothetical protein